MTGIVLLTHEGLAETLLNIVESVTEHNRDGLQAVSVRQYEPIGEIEDRVTRAIDIVGGAPVLILTDQFGSTPANVASSFCRRNDNIEAVTGVNMPMLLRVLTRRSTENDLVALAEAAVEGGVKNISRMRSLGGRPARARQVTVEPQQVAPEPPRRREEQQEVPVVNKLGLHAAAAAKLVQLANSFKSEVFIGKEGREINAKSILGVLTLAAAKGSSIVIRTVGEDAPAALAAITDLIARKFDEAE